MIEYENYHNRMKITNNEKVFIGMCPKPTISGLCKTKAKIELNGLAIKIIIFVSYFNFMPNSSTLMQT